MRSFFRDFLAICIVIVLAGAAYDAERSGLACALGAVATLGMMVMLVRYLDTGYRQTKVLRTGSIRLAEHP